MITFTDPVGVPAESTTVAVGEDYERPCSREVVEDNFRISAQQVDPGIVLVTIAGDLDMQTVPRVTAFLAHTSALAPRHLILDLSGVTFLSSSGLGLLIAAQSGDDGTTQGPATPGSSTDAGDGSPRCPKDHPETSDSHPRQCIPPGAKG